MVDVSDKVETKRVAVAQSKVHMLPTTLQAIQQGQLNKGEVLAVARVAGIQAAKRCAELIPLCHPLPLSKVQVDFSVEGDDCLNIEATCTVTGKTGVEMEALTAASIAALTIYDMAKAIDKGMTITDTCLLSKTGGKSGTYQRHHEAGL